MLSGVNQLKVQKTLYVEQQDKYYLIESLLGTKGDKLYFITTNTYEVDEYDEILEDKQLVNYNQTDMFLVSELVEKFQDVILKLLPELITGSEYSTHHMFDDVGDLSEDELDKYRKELDIEPDLIIESGHFNTMANGSSPDEINTGMTYQLTLEYIKVKDRDYYLTNRIVEIIGSTDDEDAYEVGTLDIYHETTTDGVDLKVYTESELKDLGSELLNNFMVGQLTGFVEDK